MFQNILVNIWKIYDLEKRESKLLNFFVWLIFQYFADPLICMEYILDSLKLLDYESQFCKQK